MKNWIKCLKFIVLLNCPIQVLESSNVQTQKTKEFVNILLSENSPVLKEIYSNLDKKDQKILKATSKRVDIAIDKPLFMQFYEFKEEEIKKEKEKSQIFRHFYEYKEKQVKKEREKNHNLEHNIQSLVKSLNHYIEKNKGKDEEINILRSKEYQRLKLRLRDSIKFIKERIASSKFKLECIGQLIASSDSHIRLLQQVSELNKENETLKKAIFP